MKKLHVCIAGLMLSMFSYLAEKGLYIGSESTYYRVMG